MIGRAHQPAPLILEIKGNSLDDGPGIRSVVFFKGCPLSCAWCHNPESKKTGVEISFDARICIGCGSCREVCPRGALDPDNPRRVIREKCDLCFACVEACPSHALEQVGRRMTVSEILDKILPDKPFFDTSGGGVTLSGGEPTLYMEFTAELAIAIKAAGIHTILETCGHFDSERFVSLLYPALDAIYFDLKLLDSAGHKKYCGLPNERILKNFRLLADRARQDGKTLLARTPLIPGITDTPTNLTAIAEFLKASDITKATLLSYNPLWHEKCGKVGMDDPFQGVKSMATFPDRALLGRCRALFAGFGIDTNP